MSEIEEETPIQAISKTKITSNRLKQEISFFYNDPTEIYYSYIKADLADDLIDDVTSNMQSFLSADSIKINNQEIPLIITATKLDFFKNKKTKPILEFTITNNSDFSLVEKSIQTIVLEAEKEILDYPITSSWKFPGKIVSIESQLKHKITGFQVVFQAEQGFEIGGEEILTFYYGKNKVNF